MGIYLNPSNDGFRETLNTEIYVDKSALIGYTNRMIGTRRKYICVSRPRRFGKTITAEMLTAYYCKAYDSHELFEKLNIAQSDSFDRYINKYSVLFLNMQTFLSRAKEPSKMTSYMEKKVVSEVSEKYGVKHDDLMLSELLEKIYSETGEQFVIIIDEWDCIFREYPDSTAEQKAYLDFMRELLKDKAYVALVYMTGILPIKKYGTHSALNMFDEFSMTDMGELAPYTGFTTEEVKELSDRFNVDFSEMERWYNGYLIEDRHIYNPKSVVDALTKRRFGNYWTKTETYEALKYYIDLNIDGLKEDIIKLLSGEKIKINSLKFPNDMRTFRSKDDIFTLLVHLGYLSFERTTEKVFIPNEEIKAEFAVAVEEPEWGSVAKAIQQSDELLEATLAKDSDKTAAYIDVVHDDNTSLLKYNDENSLSCVIALAYYSASRYYTIIRELPTGKGFADLAFIPRKGVDKPAIIVELKWDKTAEGAIEQIKSKKYTGALKDYNDVLLVGINYDKETKKHSCSIE